MYLTVTLRRALRYIPPIKVEYYMYRNRPIIEYSIQRITAAIGDLTLIRHEMYFSFAVRYSANQPVRIM
jgi:hypothetical protein